MQKTLYTHLIVHRSARAPYYCRYVGAGKPLGLLVPIPDLAQGELEIIPLNLVPDWMKENDGNHRLIQAARLAELLAYGSI